MLILITISGYARILKKPKSIELCQDQLATLRIIFYANSLRARVHQSIKIQSLNNF